MNEGIHGEKTAPELQDELTEVTRHRAAISEVLRAIASSPHDLQPIFDTILDSARRLCQAEVGSLRLSEQAGFRLVAIKHNLPWSPPELLEHSSYIGQFAASRSPVHIPDQAAHELYRRGDPYLLTTVDVGGYRTGLFVPMVKDEKVIGVLIVGRTRVQPFTDKQIELVTDCCPSCHCFTDCPSRAGVSTGPERAGTREPRSDNGTAHGLDCP